LPYRLLPDLSGVGDSVDIVGRLELASLGQGAMQASLPQGVGYRLKLTNTGGAVLLNGNVEATAEAECMRCLEPAVLRLEAEVMAYYLLEEGDASLDTEDGEAIMVGRDGLVDLSEPILAGLAYELPFVVLCQEECKGLCDKCFANLNTEECVCTDEPDPDHPLAGLRDLIIE
jgi:uncharacterized protein